jgi:2-iminobutanoate/2-iminopropanoate deaminase
MIRKMLFTLVSTMVFGLTAHTQVVEFKNPEELGKPNGYSQVVVVNRGRLVLISGQIGLNAKGETPADFIAQARRAFANLKTALAAVGATPADIIKLNYYVVGSDHEKLTALPDVRDDVVDKTHPPASTLAGVQILFREDAQIEIEAEAALP